MIDIAVIGSGISGLSVAWHLSKKGFEVKVFEKEDLPGGNIQTVKKDGFILELGPQTILADKRVEEFLSGAGIELEYASERAKIRYIYKKGKAYTPALISLELSKVSPSFPFWKDKGSERTLCSTFHKARGEHCRVCNKKAWKGVP